MQAYSDPTRETDPYSLPDIEVFEHDPTDSDCIGCSDPDNPLEAGWYWWSCFPGCLPDSDPIGPFDTELDALEDARDI